MVDIPIELFLGFIGISVSMAIFGFIRQPQIPAMLVFAGMFILTISIITDNIIFGFINSQIANVTTNVIDGFNVETSALRAQNTIGSSDLTLRSGSTTYATFNADNANSDLIGLTVNTLELPLKKTGSPTGTALVCSFSITGSCTYEFNSIDVSLLTTSYLNYNFTNLSYNDIILTQGQRLGIYYSGGDISNNIQVQYSNTDVYDSTNTIKATATGTLGGTPTFNTQTGEDMKFKLYDINIITKGIEQQVYNYNPNAPILYNFSELPKTLFALLGVIFMLSGALMVMRIEQ